MVCRSVCHNSEPCKNGCTDRAAAWVEDLGGPGNHVLDGGPDPPREGTIWRGKDRRIVKYRDTLRSSVPKRLNRSRCRLGCGLGWAVGVVLDGGLEMLRDVAIATNFGPQFAIIGFVGYNCGCMMASDTLFDSRGGFSWSSYPMKT